MFRDYTLYKSHAYVYTCTPSLSRVSFVCCALLGSGWSTERAPESRMMSPKFKGQQHRLFVAGRDEYDIGVTENTSITTQRYHARNYDFMVKNSGMQQALSFENTRRAKNGPRSVK